MPPARLTHSPANRRRETAEGQGCLSGFALPPLLALVVGVSFLVFLSQILTRINIWVANADTGVIHIRRKPLILSPIFTPEIQYWGQQIVRWAADYQPGSQPGGNGDAN